MKSFGCSHCGNKVYFENTSCLKCSHALGFQAETLSMIALEKTEQAGGLFRRTKGPNAGQVTYCSNFAHGACNWLKPANDPTGLCVACDLNRTIPNLSEPGNLEAWNHLERAKKRLVYSLLRFALPLDAGASGKGRLTFDFARNTGTGHLDGVISVDIMEADAVERERQRQYFGEPYRSLLGHLRHESGHFYWMTLVEGASLHDEFRGLFGDESQDYSEALARHHANGPLADWQTSHVSAYASAHPWEDWAETWAHYLHMVDALDTAESEGMDPRSAGFSLGSVWPFKKYDLYQDASFPSLMERWIPLTIAMNRMSRSMGHTDFYPFVIPARAYAKLAFVHKVIRDGSKEFSAQAGKSAG
jgi:hypothetical protein